MSDPSNAKFFVTGATGQLGRLVVDALLERVPADRIVAGVRTPGSEAAASLKAKGIELRIADYARRQTLDDAFEGIDRLLLISSSEIGRRAGQHRNVVDAAKAAGVGFIAYTSVLKADTSPLGLAGEHRETEAYLKSSGVPFALLRNGWYTENYTASIPSAVAHGVLIGSAGEGRIASAARMDYAQAAAAVLTAPDTGGETVYELAGDEDYTLSQFAAAISQEAGKSVVYRNLSQAEHEAALLGAGLPQGVASLLADSDTGASKGALDWEGSQLSELIGRPTTPYRTTIAETLARR